MVSYYNTLTYSQKHNPANLAYAANQSWQWPSNYHAPPHQQYLNEIDTQHAAAHHQMYYSPHPMFHSASTGGTASEWHSPSSMESFVVQNGNAGSHHQLLAQQQPQQLQPQDSTQQQQHQLHQPHHVHQLSNINNVSACGSPLENTENSTIITLNNDRNTHLSQHHRSHQQQEQQQQHVTVSPSAALQQQQQTQPQQQQQQKHSQERSSVISDKVNSSPPITVSGSNVSSPDAPVLCASPSHNVTTMSINSAAAAAAAISANLSLHSSNSNHSSKNNNINNHNSSNNSNNSNTSNSIHNSNNSHRQQSHLKIQNIRMMMNSSVQSRNCSSKGQQYYDWMKKPTYSSQPAPGK